MTGLFTNNDLHDLSVRHLLVHIVRFQKYRLVKRAAADPNVARVKKLVESVFCTEYSDLRTESPVVLKYLRERKKVFTC